MEEVRENKMGTQPIGDLLFKMSLPIMISMLVQALYNIVDSIFVAKISEDALTAVSLAFPVQNLNTGDALLATALGSLWVPPLLQREYIILLIYSITNTINRHHL